MSIHFGYSEKKETIIERFVEKPPSSYKTIFEINMGRSTQTLFTASDKLRRVEDGIFNLHQELVSRSPIFEDKALKTETRALTMLFDCPRMMTVNISIFIVLKMEYLPTGKWGYIIGNDDGAYDKFIAFKKAFRQQLSYGGGWPAKEYICTYPTAVQQSTKHLISCHWMMSNSHIRINNIVSTDSAFTANVNSIGAPFGSIFLNQRYNQVGGINAPLLSDAFLGSVYGIKIVRGLLPTKVIDDINNDMMKEYSVVQKPSSIIKATVRPPTPVKPKKQKKTKKSKIPLIDDDDDDPTMFSA